MRNHRTYSDVLNEKEPSDFDDYDKVLFSRIPVDKGDFIAQNLLRLREKGIIWSDSYESAAFMKLRDKLMRYPDVNSHYYPTSLFPEEEVLLYAISENTAPMRHLSIGSYYGYASSCLLFGQQKGNAILVDSDPVVCELARKNLESLDLDLGISIIPENFFGVGLDGMFDMVFIDLFGDLENPDKGMRGKNIYLPTVEKVFPYIGVGGICIAHNVIPDLESIFSTDDFIVFCNENFETGEILDTTAGLAVYKK